MPTPAEIRARLAKLDPAFVPNTHCDSEFIAHAPADLAWLLAEHDRLEQKQAAMLAELTKAMQEGLIHFTT